MSTNFHKIANVNNIRNVIVHIPAYIIKKWLDKYPSFKELEVIFDEKTGEATIRPFVKGKL